MPYKSMKQRRFFHAQEEKGLMPKKQVSEFDDASKGMDLPDEVKKMAFGGPVKEPFNEDYEEGEFSQFDSAGEPHTDHEYREEHPMEYYFQGGRVGMGGTQEGTEEYQSGASFDHPDESMYPEYLHSYADGGMVMHPEPKSSFQEYSPAEKEMYPRSEVPARLPYAKGGMVMANDRPVRNGELPPSFPGQYDMEPVQQPGTDEKPQQPGSMKPRKMSRGGKIPQRYGMGGTVQKMQLARALKKGG